MLPMASRCAVQLLLAACLKGFATGLPEEACSRPSLVSADRLPEATVPSAGHCEDVQELAASAAGSHTAACLLQRSLHPTTKSHPAAEERALGQKASFSETMSRVAFRKRRLRRKQLALHAMAARKEQAYVEDSAEVHQEGTAQQMLERQQLRRTFNEMGFALEERRWFPSEFLYSPPDSLKEGCSWQPPVECARSFVYENSNFSGCASTGSFQPWCSHDKTYTGLWSRCEFACADGEKTNEPRGRPEVAREAVGRQKPIW